MEEIKSKSKTAKAALIGGVISIILSPIGILISYYLGSNLSSPKIDVKYALVDFEYQKFGSEILIPNNIIRPFQIDFELIDLMQKTQTPMDMVFGSLVDDLKKNELYKEDIDDITNLIGLTTDIINSKQDLNNKEGRLKTLNDIKTFLISKREEGTLNTKIRNGKCTIKIGMLNSGQTDDVILPEGKLNFLDNEMLIKNIRNPGYTVVKPHSFEEIRFVIDTLKSPAGVVSKWQTIIKDKSIIDFSVSLNASSKIILYKSRLEPE